MRASRAVLFFLAAAGVVQVVHFYPLLPERMASHFDGSGQPNGFQSKDAFVGLSGAILVLTVLLFGGMGPVFRKIPTRWFSLPNRDFWLAPERRAETIEAISGQLEWYGAASLALYLVIMQEVLRANLTSAPSLESSPALTVLGIYLAFTLVWIVRFVRRFRM